MEAEACVNPWVRKIEAYVPGKTLEGYVKLASNENNYGPSPKVIDALRKNAGLVYRYPYKDEGVREKIALYCGVSKESVILGNGSDELIDFVVKAFRGPSCGVFPSFSGYRLISNINGVGFIEVPSLRDFSFPVGDFKRKMRKAKIVFLCSPNNPTGNVIPEDVVEEVLALGKITVVDEAYYEFYGKPVLNLLSGYKNLIVLRTFAKAFGLAGLRAGYALADERLIKPMYKTKPPFSVNCLAQEAILAALDDVSYMKRCVGRIRKDRRVMEEKLGGKFRVFPSEANFVFTDVRPRKSSEVFQKLLDKKIIVREFGRFSGFDGEYIRVSVGARDENKRLYEALEEI